jgi:hypothetical protein
MVIIALFAMALAITMAGAFVILVACIKPKIAADWLLCAPLGWPASCAASLACASVRLRERTRHCHA